MRGPQYLTWDDLSAEEQATLSMGWTLRQLVRMARTRLRNVQLGWEYVHLTLPPHSDVRRMADCPRCIAMEIVSALTDPNYLCTEDEALLIIVAQGVIQ